MVARPLDDRQSDPTSEVAPGASPAHDSAATEHPVDLDVRTGLFIGGRWVPGPPARIEVFDPTTERPLGSVPSGDTGAVDAAVEAAALALPGWSSTTVSERADALDAIASALEERAEHLSRAIACEVGSPLPFSRATQVGLPIAVTRAMAVAAREFAWEEPFDRALVVREPVGVVAAITPWNYPLHQVMAKVSAALVAGCTVVLKPSAEAPLTAFALADLVANLGLPAGVLNVISGRGVVVGERLAAHPDVDLVSLTGSTAAGRRVMELAAATVKRVTLELGGKSATVVLDDVDLEGVVPDAVMQCFRNAGQNCSALSRLVVPRRWLPDVERLAAEAASAVIVGDPLAEGTEMGPLISSEQRGRVRELIHAGVDGGATLLVGGSDPPVGLDHGFFVRPTVFSRVTPAMRIAQEEIFGPVISILAYDGDDDAAVALANDSPYGLSGAVWSADPSRAERVARRLRTGRVAINGGRFNPRAPFGGYKGSGLGRELGSYGLSEFLEVKTLQR